MTSHVTAFDGALCFLTNAHSLKITELERDHEVSVSYVNHNDSHYVSVSGKTAVVKDPTKIKDLWSPAAAMPHRSLHCCHYCVQGSLWWARSHLLELRQRKRAVR